MAPILYSEPTSPPVRAVLLTAEVIGLKLELVNIKFLENETVKPEFLKMNPQHTIPTLNDNGFIVWDSHAICAYLVDKYAKDDSLYPKDLQKRAVVDQRLHFDSGILFPRLKNVFFPTLILGHKTLPGEYETALDQAYAFANAFLEDSVFFAGNQLTIADFCAIGTLSSIVPVVPFETSKYPHLDRWMKKMEALPYYKKLNGDGAVVIANMVKKGLGRL